MSETAGDVVPAGKTVAVYPPGSQGAYNPPQVRIVEKIYLNLDEASQLSGLSKTYLQGKIAAGQLRMLDDGGTRVRRSDLELL